MWLAAAAALVTCALVLALWQRSQIQETRERQVAACERGNTIRKVLRIHLALTADDAKGREAYRSLAPLIAPADCSELPGVP